MNLAIFIIESVFRVTVFFSFNVVPLHEKCIVSTFVEFIFCFSICTTQFSAFDILFLMKFDSFNLFIHTQRKYNQWNVSRSLFHLLLCSFCDEWGKKLHRMRKYHKQNAFNIILLHRIELMDLELYVC